MIKPSLVVALCLLTAGCSTATNNQTPAESPTPTSLVGCYVAKVGADHAYLNLLQTDSGVRGTLEYAFTQKDSSWGLIRGESTDSALKIEYEFISEGIVSTRTLTVDRTADGFSGEGFTYTASATCGTAEDWVEAKTSDPATDTIHDPETGYYARVRFSILDQASSYQYRCIATVTDANNEIISDWVAFGNMSGQTASTKLTMQTNIRPEQVKQVASGRLICQTNPTS